MGFTEILTIIFVVLKVLEIIDWSWWLVLLPEIIAAVVYLIIVFCCLKVQRTTLKHVKSHFWED